MKSAPARRDLNWVNILFFLGTPLITFLLMGVYIHLYGIGFTEIAVALVLMGVNCLSITAGYHRLLTHRSYELAPWMEAVLLIVGAGAFEGPALQWCSDHRRHHRFADTEKDPHNIREGFMHAHLYWMFYKDDPAVANVYPPDLLRDKLVMWQAKYYTPLAITVAFIIPTLIGWIFGNPLGGLVFGGGLKMVLAHHATFFINSLAHTWGKQTYTLEETARDSWLMAFLAYGEGFHNYHHQFQSDYRNGIRWYHWDPTKWLIRAMALFGVARSLKRAPAGAVLRARLSVEQSRMVNLGVPVDRVAALRERVEQAQVRWKELGENYRVLRGSLRERSSQKLAMLKAEIRAARLEFQLSKAQWAVFLRTMKSAKPALAAGLN